MSRAGASRRQFEVGGDENMSGMPVELPPLVPKPVSVQQRQGSFVLTEDLAVDASPTWAAIARRLLSPGTGLSLPTAPGAALAVRADASLPAEGYRLEVSATGIDISAADDRGVNWAVQTLRQLLPSSVYRPAPSGERLEVPAVIVEDHPRFSWRGVMLDTARHFMPLNDLYSFVDLLAIHKVNTFHLHLTEDQGWRFESKKYPRLQALASSRAETVRPTDEHGDGTPHGGFYTQEQLRSLVTYADQRGITIVPELEFPGHVSSVLAAYPEFGNNPAAAHSPATGFGVFERVLNMSDDAVRFVFDLYEELLDVFPSRYIHVGGDECPRTEWHASQAAQSLAEQRGLPDAGHLQNWFTRQLRDWLSERGRQLVGWDEINNEGHLDGAITMAWREASHGVEAVKAGGQTVMAPSSHTYFDHYPGPGADEPYSIGGLIPTERVYGLDPLENVPPDAESLVLGTQCQIWTEYIPTMRRVQYMLYPRACAHSEVAWSDPGGRSWDEFSPRLAGHVERLQAMGVNVRPESGPLPWQHGGTGALRRPPHHLAD